ncbi:MAG: hypothetical protein IJR45_04500 [Firmicutes bacterium]|nr:hypothetical protein [Bacillota bacterium]
MKKQIISKTRQILTDESGNFTIIGLVIAVVLMVTIAAFYFSSGNTENETALEQQTEVSAIASTLYHSAQVYVTTQQSMGVTFEPNASIPTSALTSGLDTSQYKTFEVKMDSAGTNIKYAYVEANDGSKADYPSGASGKAN